MSVESNRRCDSIAGLKFYFDLRVKEASSKESSAASLAEVGVCMACHGRTAKANHLCSDCLRLVGDSLAETHQSLQRRIEELTRERDRLLDHCPGVECSECAVICCPHGDPLHFHHDGCPACLFSVALLSPKEQP
jgi:hypothetical protein